MFIGMWQLEVGTELFLQDRHKNASASCFYAFVISFLKSLKRKKKILIKGANLLLTFCSESDTMFD